MIAALILTNLLTLAGCVFLYLKYRQARSYGRNMERECEEFAEELTEIKDFIPFR